MLNVKIDAIEDKFTYTLDKYDPNNCAIDDGVNKIVDKHVKNILFYGIVWCSFDIAVANSLIKIAKEKTNTFFVFKLFSSELEMENISLNKFHTSKTPLVIGYQNSNYTILCEGNISFDELRQNCLNW